MAENNDFLNDPRSVELARRRARAERRMDLYNRRRRQLVIRRRIIFGSVCALILFAVIFFSVRPIVKKAVEAAKNDTEARLTKGSNRRSPWMKRSMRRPDTGMPQKKRILSFRMCFTIM